MTHFIFAKTEFPERARPNVVVEWLTLVFRIREVPSSVLGSGDRLSYKQRTDGAVSRIIHSRRDQESKSDMVGHVERMSEDRVIKKLYMSKPEGRRSVGRPKMRWLDDVEEDL
jgi:hypothetical protein